MQWGQFRAGLHKEEGPRFGPVHLGARLDAGAISASWWRTLGGSALALAGCVCPAVAGAQALGSPWVVESTPDLDRSDVAGRRVEAGLEPDPHRVGPILVRPLLAVIGGYDGNVFNESTARSDALLIASPRIDMKLDDPRHAITLSLAGKLRRFTAQDTENSNEVTLASANHFELARDVTFGVTFDAAHRIEPRSSSGSAIDALEPVSYDRLGADASIEALLGSIRVGAGGGYRQTAYDTLSLRSGTDIDQSYRDMESVHANVRLGYDLSGFLSTFVQASGDKRSSRHPEAGFERDSTDVSAVIGLKGALSALFSLEASAGYQARDYDNARYRDFGGLGFAVEVEWYPTPLVTGQFSLTRRFRNGGSRDVAGILEDSFAANLFYDPTRRLRLAAGVAAIRDRYRDTSTRVRRYRLALRAQYTLNRHVALGAQVYWIKQDVSGQPQVNSYTSPGAGIGITFTP